MEIKEALQRIEILRQNGQFVKAYKLCVQILEVDPGDSKATRLLGSLEKEIRDSNIKSVKDAVIKLEPLWERKKFKELLSNYHQLYELAPNYEPLLKLIAKAETKLKEEIKEEKKVFLDKYKLELEGLLNTERYEEAVLRASQTEAAYPSNRELKEIGQKIRLQVIEHQLDKNEPLFNSRQYIRIVKFLLQLQQLEPSYKKIRKLIEKYKKKGLTNLSDDQQEFVYRGLSHTETLIQLKKYDKAIKTAEEVLEIDPMNGKAMKMLKKAKKGAKKQILNEVVSKIKKDLPHLKEEFRANRQAFITI